MGRAVGAYKRAVRIKNRRWWYRHAMRRGDLVGVAGRLAHADGQVEVEVLVGGQVV